jgi:TolB-like protein
MSLPKMQSNSSRPCLRRYKRTKRASLVLLFGMILAPNLRAQARLVAHNDPNVAAGPRQAEIIINAENSEKDILVWVNGITVAHLAPKTSEKIIVNNGNYTLEAAETTWSRNNWSIGSKKRIAINSNSNRITVGMTWRYGGLVSLVVQSTFPLDAVAPTLDHAIMDALSRTADEIIAELPRNTILAVLSISSADPSLPSDFVIDELIHMLVSARKFTLVERERLDLIRAEINFQYSGDVDDNSAADLGKQLGASTVITGSIGGSGTLRRFRTRVLDVQTAAILFTTAESF